MVWPYEAICYFDIGAPDAHGVHRHGQFYGTLVLGPSVEDGQWWGWQKGAGDDATELLVAGPLPDREAAVKWATAYHLRNNPAMTRTKAFKVLTREERRAAAAGAQNNAA